MDIPRGIIELLVSVEQSYASASDMAQWAVGALEDGYDTASLRILASFRREDLASEAEPYLRRALREMEITPPTGEALLRAYAAEIARRVVIGTIAPVEAVNLIHGRVITPLNHPDDLMAWCLIWEGNNPEDWSADVEDLADDEYAALVQRCARRHLETSCGGGDISDRA